MSIGDFYWVSIPERMEPLNRVRRAWRSAELDLSYLPAPRRASDVAAEAVSLSKLPLRRLEDTVDCLMYTGEEPDSCLMFDKHAEQFVAVGIDDESYDQVRKLYSKNEKKISARKHRRALSSYLAAAGAEKIHAWIYFMPPWGAGALTAVDAMIFALYGTDGEFHRIPVDPTSTTQLEYLRVKLSRQLTWDIETLTSDVRVAILNPQRSRRLRSDRVEALLARWEAIIQRHRRLSALLEPEGLNTAGAFTDLLTALDELRESRELDPVRTEAS